MRTAICLIGEYSSVYEYNKYQGDLYMVSAVYDEGMKCAKQYKIIDDMATRLVDVHDMNKFHVYKQEMANECCSMINRDDYDIVIIALFITIHIKIPTIAGVYNFFETRGNDVQILSDISFRYNTFEFIRDSNIHLRKLLFDRMYGGSVCDFENFNPVPINKNQVMFCIPSVINISENPYTASMICNKRSLFTGHERFAQTLRQVKRLKETIRDCVIYLLEGSHITFSEMKELSKYSTVILFTLDKQGNMYANENRNKSLYEMYAIKNIVERQVEFGWMIKFGARYNICNSFDIDRYKGSTPMFKKLDGPITYAGKDILECVIYSIPYNYREKMLSIYNNVLETNQDTGIAIENLFHTYIKDYTHMKVCNVVGKDGVYGLEKAI